MSNAVMISIRPKWCEMIASGRKTIEVRKTRPKIKAPFKCYIYCTLVGTKEYFHSITEELGVYQSQRKWNKEKWYDRKGKIIGEFICDYIDEYQAEFTDLNIYDSLDNNVCQNTISKIIGYNEYDDVEEIQYITGNEEENPDDCELMKKSCLTFNELRQYIGETFYDKSFYGYHISDLKIYDQPKELSEFCKPCKDPYRYCQKCKHGLVKYPSWVETSEDLDGCCFDTECLNVLHRPPQSWCYVEDLEADDEAG